MNLVSIDNLSKNVKEVPLFSDVSLGIDSGEKIGFVGPNGSGKTTFLELITGDNMQVFCNDVRLFGNKRGSGESIWDIKKKLGIVSYRLHVEYRMLGGTSLINVIISGFRDSIGLYGAATDVELAAAKNIRADVTPTELAFRWLQSVPGILTILSGMSKLEQMKDNVATFQSDKPLNEIELKAVAELASSMINPKIQPCTACRYCTSHCPNQIDIPLMMSLYNEAMVTGADWRQTMALNAIDKSHWPQACIGCGACESVCPQSLKIPQVMADFVKLIG